MTDDLGFSSYWCANVPVGSPSRRAAGDIEARRGALASDTFGLLDVDSPSSDTPFLLSLAHPCTVAASSLLTDGSRPGPETGSARFRGTRRH
ncbi:hypothetical protein ACWCQQ_33625 [Streptomyces sp. NPDC002143]